MLTSVSVVRCFVAVVIGCALFLVLCVAAGDAPIREGFVTAQSLVFFWRTKLLLCLGPPIMGLLSFLTPVMALEMKGYEVRRCSWRERLVVSSAVLVTMIAFSALFWDATRPIS